MSELGGEGSTVCKGVAVWGGGAAGVYPLGGGDGGRLPARMVGGERFMYCFVVMFNFF